ncbi:MAG: T9SS type A sorting domain-containing protein [Bacteroidetes bacterium]|nr:T9SS type A sorting domain-containing protein [Bacteroidota bacterium]
MVQKNILLHTPVAEKVAGVYHTNGKDVWVMTHEWNSNNFFAYLVTNSGVDTVPIISSIGSVHSGITSDGNSVGYLKFSPNGKKIVSLQSESSVVELFDFNDSTGVVSNGMTLPVAYSYAYGASFSPNNSRLYISYFGTGGGSPQPGKLFQYDLLAGTPQDIINSQTLIYASSGYWYCGLQNGADRKIYLSRINLTFNDGTTLGAINYPNKLYASCSFLENDLYLSGKYCRYGLPNFIESYFNCDTCAVELNGIQEIGNYSIKIFPNPVSSILYIQSPTDLLKSIELYNLFGIKIYDNLYSSTKNIGIDISPFTKGIYFIKIISVRETLIKKIIVTN